MSKVNFPVNNYDAYHAHVYFDKETFTFAKALCEKAGELFQLQVGRAHQKLVGPHPRWSCQLLFTSSDFEQLIPWLEKERNGLTVLVHALTGDNLKDHTEHAYWLGHPVALNLSIFQSN